MKIFREVLVSEGAVKNIKYVTDVRNRAGWRSMYFTEIRGVKRRFGRRGGVD